MLTNYNFVFKVHGKECPFYETIKIRDHFLDGRPTSGVVFLENKIRAELKEKYPAYKIELFDVICKD